MIEELEEWRDVPSQPRILASNLGRVKLKPWVKAMPKGEILSREGKPTFGIKFKANKQAKHVYYGWRIREIGNLKIHRLICEAFHGPAPFPKAVVIHLDENALNNRPENLKWGTQKENLNMPKFKEYCRNRTGENSSWTKGQKRKAAE